MALGLGEGSELRRPMALAVGVLPYPLTFLCTDIIGELYGRRRANTVVWVGLDGNGAKAADGYPMDDFAIEIPAGRQVGGAAGAGRRSPPGA